MQNKGLENQNNFLVFGGGTRQCPGKELGIAEISTFLHYFVTRYRLVKKTRYSYQIFYPKSHTISRVKQSASTLRPLSEHITGMDTENMRFEFKSITIHWK